MNKKIFALLLLVFVVLSISAVSANDLDDTNQTLASDSSQININESSVGDNNVLEKNNEEILGISDSENNVLGITPTLTITSYPSELDEGVDGQLKCQLTYTGMGLESQTVFLYVNGEQTASAIVAGEDGECTFNLNFPTSGTYTLQCKYDGYATYGYDPCESETVTITVGGGTPVEKTKVYFENYGNTPSTMDKGDDVTVSMIVYSDNQYGEVMTQPVRFKLTGKTAQLYASSDSTGIATFSLSTLPAGTYTVSISVDDENYESDDSVNFQITVNGDEPSSDGGFDELYSLLSASDVVTLEKDYKYTSTDLKKYFNLAGRQITINGNGHTIDASSENMGNYLFYMGSGSIKINNTVITNVKGNGILFAITGQLDGVTIINSEVNDIIKTSSYQSYISNSKFINNTVTNILSESVPNIIQNVFLNNSISGYLLNSPGYEIEHFDNNVLINDNNAINVYEIYSQKGNYRGTDGITINGPDKITTASKDYTFSLSNADLPEFDLLVDITSEYASLDKTVVTLGGGKTATVTVNAKKSGNATLTVGSELVCDPIGTKSIEILYDKVKTRVQFDAVPAEVTVEEGSGSLSLYVVDTSYNGVSGVNVKLTANETVLNAVSGSEGALTFDLSSVPAGEYSAVVVVDDEDYESNTVNIQLIVNEKPKTPVHLSDYTATTSIVMTGGDARTYTATVEDINFNDVVVGVRVKLTAGDNVVYATSNQNGEAAFDLSGVSVFDGTAVVVVDDDNYKSSDSLSFALTVNEKVKTPVRLFDYTYTTSIVMTEGDARTYTATVEDINRMDIVKGVRVKLTAGDNVVYATSNQNGEAAFDLSGVGVFDGTAVVVVDDDNYKSSDSLSFTLTVNEKVKTSVVISDFPGNIVITEGEVGNFFVNVYNNLEDCYPISGARVKLTADENVVYATSDENGYVSFDLSSIPAGTYTPSVVVDDENYKSNTVTFSLTVNPKIEVDLEYNYPRVGKEIFIFEDESDTVKFKVINNFDGQPIEGINVKFILNESEYNNISDSEGIASFKISDLDVGFYNLTAEVDDNKVIYYSGQLPVDVCIVSRELTYTPQNYTADNIKVPYGGSVDWNVVNSAGRNIEGEVTISTDSGSKTATVSGGNFTSDFSGLNAGTHEVTFSIENYTDKVFNIEILPVNTKTELIIPQNPQVGTQFTIKAKVNATNGQITFYIDGVAVQPVDVENGEASYHFTQSAVGNIKVSANYTDSNGNYNSSSDSGIINVIKKSWELLDPAGQVIYYNESFYKMAWDGEVGITGEFTLKNDTFETTLPADNGILNFNLILDVGTYTFNITSDYYEDKELTITINPAPTETNLTGPESITIEEDKSLTATVNTTSGQIAFYVNGELNQTVDLNGKNSTTFDLSVLPAGNYTITANYSDPKGNYKNSAASIKVTVNKIDTTITVETEPLDLKVDEDSNIMATLNPSDAGNLTYTSSNESVVTVDSEGKVIGVGAGDATITVSFAGNDKYNAAENKTVAVSVSKIATVISVFPPNTIIIGQNNSFFSAVLDDDTQNPIEGLMPTFTFSDENIAKIYYVGPTPIIQGISAGNVNITFSFAGNNKYAAAEDKVVTVTVLKIPANIIVENTNVTMNALDSVDVGTTLDPKEAGNLTFTSSNPDVAEVSDGKIIAKAKGTTTITVSLKENDKYGAENKTINVTVNLNDASVSVLNDTASIIIDEVYSIDAIVDPKNLTVTYESSNPEVASVNNDGVVTGLKNGTAVITLTVGDGKTYAINSTTVTVTVSKIPTEIIANATLDMYVGDIASDIARLEPDTGDNLNYTPFNPGVVKVEDGKIVAVAEGTTIVIVNYFGNDKYASANSKLIKVTVKLRDASVSVKNDTVSIVIDEVYSIDAIVDPKNLTVTYESSNPEVASVNNDGVVTGLKNGTAVITLTVGDGKTYAINSTAVTVTVSKIPTKIILNNASLDMKVGDIASNVARLEPDTGDDLNYTLSKPGVVKVEDGKIVAVANGTALVFVSYDGNDKYEAAFSEIIVVAVSLRDASVSVNNATLDLLVGDEFIVVVTTNPKGLDVTFTPDNSGVVSVDENGVVTALKEGEATIKVSIGGDGVYALNTTDVTVTVSKIPTNISAEVDSELAVGDNSNVKYNLTPSDATGKVTFKSSNTKVLTVDAKGNVKAVGEGSATITLTYAGDNKYAPSNTTVSVKVSKSEIKPEIEQNDTTLTVSVPGDATGDVTVTIGNETIKAPIKDGKAVIDLSDVPAGDYNATVSYPGDNKYSGFEVVAPVNIGSKFQLIVENLTKYYHGSERFAVKALDGKGNPISGAEVKISLNGMTYTRVTDENGSASIGVNLESGVFIATVSCNNTTVEATITVLTTVNGTDLVKVFRNATQYYATFRDSQGNYLKEGTAVRFNIHGVFYDRQVSGDKGLAKLNINLEQGEYIITAINLETGESRANNITVLPRIVENYDLTKYYRNESQYTVKLIGDDGKAVGAGENVTFNINGVFYTRTTNASGIAKLNINLQPGDYIITAGYKDCMVSNKIKVLPVLTAKDLTKKYGTKDQFVANLVDGQGKPYAGQSVQFNINGVFYNRITDSNGQAKLNINLQPGEYIITSSYNGASIGNKVTVTA